ncbi:MAG TPA: ABC transporter transmembrane domain-containing protein, partial [Acidimicrobiia bacterium]|nr:ABC transporter transmembrane domain-containing protein [Acidimicrobiia bacterium]
MTTAAPSYRATLKTYLGPLRARLVVLVLLLLGSIALQLITPLILSEFINAANLGTTVQTLTAFGIAYLAAGVVNQVLEGFSTYLGADVGWTATNQLREDLAAHLLGLDMGFHNETTPGEMIERVDGDVTALANFIS